MSVSGSRVKLQTLPPLPTNKCWFEITPNDGHGTVRDVAISICTLLSLGPSIRASDLKLEVEGFELIHTSLTKGIVRDSDLITVSLSRRVPRDETAKEKLPPIKTKRKRRGDQSEEEPAPEEPQKKKKTVEVDDTQHEIHAARRQHLRNALTDLVRDIGSSSSSEEEEDEQEETSSESGDEMSGIISGEVGSAALKEVSNDETTSSAESDETSSSESETEASESPRNSTSESSDDDSEIEESVMSGKKHPADSIARPAAPPLDTVKAIIAKVVPLKPPKLPANQKVAPRSKEKAAVAKQTPAPQVHEVIAPPVSLGRHKRKQTRTLLNVERTHVIFADNDEDAADQDEEEGVGELELATSNPVEPAKSLSKAGTLNGTRTNGLPPAKATLAPPRAIHTKVFLEDDFNNPTPKKGRKRSQSRTLLGSAGTPGKGRGGTTLAKNGTDGVSREAANGAKADTGLQQPDAAAAVDYDALPLLVGKPKTGQTIAYKVLQMSESYCPEISDFKEATIIAFDIQRSLITLKPKVVKQPTPQPTEEYEDYETGEIALGRFELPPDDEWITEASADEVTTFDMAALMDVRVVS
ncbi:uncharacterized protein EV422DRAFT_600869 [Fimicolochytrium jonesii]|uniref:uncharacterized protein n=1 Tax=Fimicolochytrium jonesii TaxID=1396493 RepID=UPI0022FE0500|nr:uncharacterized protein EV422DRAFT_600869 [Fimicolochytrium jonesii]KAI8826079.1 hypothetical protein EV422DRAFT_600869 [Fimicolochytrium jonesii]